MQNDPEYHEQLLESRKTIRERKQKALEEDPLHANARTDADRMAKARRVARDTQEVQDAEEREEMIERVRQRYFSLQFLTFNQL
jgi:hypothetical protein